MAYGWRVGRWTEGVLTKQLLSPLSKEQKPSFSFSIQPCFSIFYHIHTWYYSRVWTKCTALFEVFKKMLRKGKKRFIEHQLCYARTCTCARTVQYAPGESPTSPASNIISLGNKPSIVSECWIPVVSWGEKELLPTLQMWSIEMIGNECK